MQKIRLNFGIGRRDRASKIVTTMLEAFENVPHNAIAKRQLALGSNWTSLRLFSRIAKHLGLALAYAAC